MEKYPVFKLKTINFKLLALSLCVLIISYLVMYWGIKFTNDFLSLTLSPVLQLAGYVMIVTAILRN